MSLILMRLPVQYKATAIRSALPRAASKNDTAPGAIVVFDGNIAVASAAMKATASAATIAENHRDCTAVAMLFLIDELAFVEGSAGGPCIRCFRHRWRGEVCL